MTDVDIYARLRTCAEVTDAYTGVVTAGELTEAADAIAVLRRLLSDRNTQTEGLAEEIVRLRAENKKAHEANLVLTKQHTADVLKRDPEGDD